MSQKAIGIIAEYNPLHNGHRYHIEKASESGDPLVVVLSSNFLQRGEPAFIDKESRARMALLAGADLVLELPVAFSCHNAGVFANGAVDILEATGVVDRISFGMENVPADLDAILAILVDEPDPFKANLRYFLDSGLSYVQARAEALEKIHPGSRELLSQPNNSLAISYMTRIAQKGYGIRAIPITRIGGGYHQIELHRSHPSATSIRLAIREKNPSAMDGMPENCASILRDQIKAGRCCLKMERLWEYLRLLLLRTTPQELRQYAEFGEGIENRFLRQSLRASSWDELISTCVTKRYPRGRLQRNMIHFLINLGHDLNREFQRKGPAYIRPIAATPRGRDLLRTMNDKASLPLVTRLSHLKGYSYGSSMMELELRACDLWELLTPNGLPGTESKRHPYMA